MDNKTIGLYKHKCKICGNTFESRADYVYKRGSDHNYIWFCSYHCMRNYDRRKKKGA